MSQQTLEQWLRAVLDQHGAVAGTVHVLRGDELEITAAINLPESVQKAIKRIPRGTGLAGLAWEQNRPIATSNLKEDTTGVVPPGAQEVDAQGAVALPVLDADGKVHAVVGLAFSGQRSFNEADLTALTDSVKGVPIDSRRSPQEAIGS